MPPLGPMRPTCAVIQCGPTRHAHAALASMYPFVMCAIGTAPSAAWRDCAGGPNVWPRIEGGTPSLPGGRVSPIWISRGVGEKFLENFRNF